MARGPVRQVCSLAALLACVGAASVAVGAEPPQGRIAFKACPIVQDTDTVPCWVSEYDGELYYIGIQTDSSAPYNPPYLGHQALFEGHIKDRPRICGGIVLEPVNVAVMPELDPGCDEIRPASDRYKVDFHPRGPGPSTGQLAFRPPPPVSEGLTPPYEPRTFTLYYDFDTPARGRHYQALNSAFEYARATGATTFVIASYRGATLLSDGSVLTEKAAISRIRAQEVERLLNDAGLAGRYDVNWTETPVEADGVDDWQSRRTDITVEP